MSDTSINSRSYSTSSVESSQQSDPASPTEPPARLERKDFPSTSMKSASESARSQKGVTPKQLRFRMISPSNSGASGGGSFMELHQPVIVKPITGPNPVIVKNPAIAELNRERLARKTSFIATVNGSNDASSSSGEFHRAVIMGNPTPVDFLNDSKSNLSDATTDSSFNSNGEPIKKSDVILTLPINPTNKEDTVSLPKSGRTHANAFVGVDRPREGEADYFQFQFPPNKRACGVVIPFFNEERRELQRTLEHLEVQSRLVWKQKNLSMHILLIMDGWSKAADSMRDYVKYMFPAANTAMPWWAPLDDKGPAAAIETFFVQRIVPYGKKRVNRCIALGDVSITPGSKEATGKDRSLYITLIVKRDNRRKHNSHEWFFGRNGFSEYYKHEYCFATDCGTLFEPDCLAALINYMEAHPTVSVCTGRQRVMSKSQQGSEESLISLDTLFRLAQCYDYESSFACFMGAFAIFGFLPVVPGPCGLYRASDILGPARDWYFEVVNTEPDKSGMVLGNLRIAEDRVLSYSAVLKTPEARSMALIPEATFYFEAECSFEKFLLQRRRWTNGTVAGYVYMCLQNPGIIFRANMNPIRKLAVYLLLVCQMLVYVVVALAPAIFLTSLHSTLGTIFPAKSFNQTYPEYLWYICIALYVFMVISHTGKKKYIAWMFYVLMIVSWIIIAGAFYGFANYIAQHGLPTTFTKGDYQWVSIYTVMMVTGFPMVIALLHSPKSFSLMVISIIPYYMFLPTLVGWFSAYAFARTWDLTWGNRPASTEHGNMSTNTIAKAEADLKAKAMTVCIFILVGNFAFIFLVQQYQNYSITIVVIAAFIFTFAAIQMLFSIVYFLFYYNPRRIIHACWAVASFPFRKRRDMPSESEDDELHQPDFKSEFGSVGRFNSKMRGASRTGSRMVIDDSVSSHEIKHSNSKSSDISDSRANTAIDVSDPDNRDPTTIVTRTPSASLNGGQVKRTPSVANAV